MRAELVVALAAAVTVLCWPAPPRTSLPGVVARVVPARAAAARRRAPASPRREPVDQLLRVLDMVAGQVRAGASPTAAWAVAAELCGEARWAATTDPVSAIVDWGRRASRAGAGGRAGAESLVLAATSAAAAWRLAERTGAPLADLLDSVCISLRDDRADRAAVEAALAGPRATSRLLLALPVVGLALGELIGAAPVHVLLQTSMGRACAATGLGLLALGRLWMRRLVAGVAVAGRPHAGSGSSMTARAA